MPNQNYDTVEELLFDKTFRDWILLGIDTNNNWERWMLQNSGKSDIVNYAKAILYTLSIRNESFTQHEIQSEIDKVLVSIDDDLDRNKLLGKEIPVTVISRSRRDKTWFGLALSGVLILFATGYFFIAKNKDVGSFTVRDTPTVQGSRSYTQYNNNSDTTLLIMLPDGSKVTLFR